MKLKELAHLRTGDKGNTCNICVIPYDEKYYHLIKKNLTENVVSEYFSEICKGTILRYEMDSICSLNFVMSSALDGGVSKSLCQDRHGKSFGMALGELEL